MDKKDENLERVYDIELDSEEENNYNLSIQEQVYEIDIRLQEIDAQIELYEEMLYQKDEKIFEDEKLMELKQEYKDLRMKKKELQKSTKGKWDQIPIWLFIYGIFQILFSLLFIMVPVSLSFVKWISSNVKVTSEFWVTTLFLLIPLICLLATGLLLIFQKNKPRKIFLLVILGFQVIETTINLIVMYK
ncbi:MAG TPA: YfhO family protein [Gallicola sp.]|jgi:hypothetical protein|nr:YfhO family protein [Gallicola sp.]